MKVSIAKIKANPQSSLAFELSEVIDAAAYGYDEFRLEGPLAVRGGLKNSGNGSFPAQIFWSGTIIQQCGRCGKLFSSPTCGSMETRFTQGALDDDEGYDQLWPISDDEADLAQAVLNEIWFHCPMQPLCRPDCRGLCPVCGVDLNQQSCSCARQEIDPRWEKLKSLKFED